MMRAIYCPADAARCRSAKEASDNADSMAASLGLGLIPSQVRLPQKSLQFWLHARPKQTPVQGPTASSVTWACIRHSFIHLQARLSRWTSELCADPPFVAVVLHVRAAGSVEPRHH